MALVYHVRTFGKIPVAKKIFNCKCKADEYVISLFREHQIKPNKKNLRTNFVMLRIDDEICKNFSAAFPVGNPVEKLIKINP